MIEKSIDCMGEDSECDISLNRGSSSISLQQTFTTHTTTLKCTRLNQNSTRYQNLKSQSLCKKKQPHKRSISESLKWTEKDQNGLILESKWP